MGNTQEIESVLRQLIAIVAPRLAEEDRAMLAEFVDGREYGLALETAADVYVSEELHSAEGAALIQRAAALLGMDAAELLEP